MAIDRTDTEKKIAEIREVLEKSTAGPWHMSKLSAGYLVDDRGKDITVFIEYNEDGSVHMEFENWQNNAHLIANAPEWLRFLLDELERLEREYAEERAAHNAHVTELSQLEEEMRKLREERDAYYNNARYTEAAFHEVTSLRSQLQSAQQEIERLGNLARQERELADHWMRKHHDDVVKLQEERDKLIEALQWYADEQNYDGSEFRLSETEKDKGQRARNILREIGVKVE